MDENIYNPAKFDIGCEDVTINSVKYIVTSDSISPSVTKIDSQDSQGAYRGQAIIKGKTGLSLTIKRVTNTDKLPTKWQTFTYKGGTYSIDNDPAESGSSGGERSFTLDCTLVLNPPQA